MFYFLKNPNWLVEFCKYLKLNTNVYFNFFEVEELRSYSSSVSITGRA